MGSDYLHIKFKIDDRVARVTFARPPVNIFNISKINSEVRGGKSPRIKRLSEYIGESYFEYLAGLPDLVLIMDESHRYRASAGVRAINELKPVIGLELTAKARRLRRPVAEIPTIWLDRQFGQSNFKMSKWIPKYLRWYRFAFGPPLSTEELRSKAAGPSPAVSADSNEKAEKRTP